MSANTKKTEAASEAETLPQPQDGEKLDTSSIPALIIASVLAAATFVAIAAAVAYLRGYIATWLGW